MNENKTGLSDKVKDTIDEVSANLSAQTNISVDLKSIIGSSSEYRELEERLSTLQRLFDKTPNENTSEREKLSKTISEYKTKIKSFKRDIENLAETFSKIDLTTDRLKRAKEHFEKGEITEARIILEVAEEERTDVISRLMAKKKDIDSALKNAAEEYLILAQATALNTENPSSFEDAARYFEASIEAEADQKNLFQYAMFLQEHNMFAQAEEYYKRILQDFANELATTEKASTLNNLGNLYANKGDYIKAEDQLEAALKLRNDLAHQNPTAFLPDVAMTLNNLGALRMSKHDLKAAEANLAEALQIYEELARTNPDTYSPKVAMGLGNLGILYDSTAEYNKAEENFSKALQIRRESAQRDPRVNLPDVARTLVDLGTLHIDLGRSETAEAEYTEALQIYRELNRENPATFWLEVSSTLSILASFYLRLKPDRERSISLAYETLIILMPHFEKSPLTEGYASRAMLILKEWGISEEEMAKEIALRSADLPQSAEMPIH